MSTLEEQSSGAAVTEQQVKTKSRMPWIVGFAVVVAALVGLGIWWLATEDGNGVTTSVTGTEICLPAGASIERADFVCEVTVSDPRVSGRRTVWLEWDRTTGEMNSTVRIENDGGSWTGVSVGYDDPSGAYEPGEQYVEGLLIGDGDYVGLQYFEHVEFGPDEYTPSQVTGTIEPTP